MKFFDIEFHFFFLQASFLKTDTSFWRIFYNEYHVLWDTLYVYLMAFFDKLMFWNNFWWTAHDPYGLHMDSIWRASSFLLEVP
jgi:hypothetical protein